MFLSPGYLVSVTVLELTDLPIIERVNPKVISGDTVIYPQIPASADRADLQPVIYCERALAAKREHLRIRPKHRVAVFQYPLVELPYGFSVRPHLTGPYVQQCATHT